MKGTLRAAPLAMLFLGVALFAANTVYGGGADLAHHYWVTAWLYDAGVTHAHPGYTTGVMGLYPEGSHVLAAAVGALVGSPLLGMHLVSLLSVALVWLSIGGLVAMLPSSGRWWAAGFLSLGLLLSAHEMPLRVQYHGWELIENYFYAQIVGQAVFWLLVWTTARAVLKRRSLLRTTAPVSIAAVVLTQVHVMPSVQLVGLLGLICLYNLVMRIQAGERGPDLLPPIAVASLTVVAVVLSPGFRAMREISLNDGAIVIPYVETVGDIVVLSLLALLAAAFLALFGRAAASGSPAVAAPLLMTAAATTAIAVPSLLQAVALQAGEGSPYAVKKYAFALLTCLLLAAALAVGALAVRLTSRRTDARPLPPLLALPSALALLAVGTVFLRPGAFTTGELLSLEDRVRAAHSVLLTEPGDNEVTYAVELPNSVPSLDYAFSLAPLGAIGPPDDLSMAVLVGAPLPVSAAGRRLLTGSGSPFALPGCVRGVPVHDLVLVDAGCWLEQSLHCNQVNHLRKGSVASLRLVSGFASPEPIGQWTEGNAASFRCRLPKELRGKQLRVSLDADAFLPLAESRQRVVVRTGGGATFKFEFESRQPQQPLEFVVPAPADGELVLDLSLPDAVSPQEAGLSLDARRLSLLVRSVAVEQVDS